MANQTLWDLFGSGVGSLGNRVGQGIGQLSGGLTGGIGQAASMLRRPTTVAGAPVQPVQQQAQANPQQGFGWLTPGQQQQPDYGGMAEYLRAMNEVRPRSFQEQFQSGLEGAMGQMGSILQGNANRTTANRMAGMDYQTKMAEIAAKERMGMNIVGALTGQMPEQYVTGQQRVSGAPMVAPGGKTIQGYTYAPTYGLRFAPREAAQAPPPPPDLGVHATPGTVWGPTQADAAGNRIGSMMAASPPGGGGTQFSDYLQSAGPRLYGNLARQGEQGEATQLLESQVAESKLQNSLRDLMTQIYGSRLGTGQDQQAIMLRMLNALA